MDSDTNEDDLQNSVGVEAAPVTRDSSPALSQARSRSMSRSFSRSPSRSMSRSISKSRSRSASRSSGDSRQNSRSRSRSSRPRSMSRSISRSSMSRRSSSTESKSRSASPAVTSAKKTNPLASDESDQEEGDSSDKEKDKNRNPLGFALTDSEDEEDEDKTTSDKQKASDENKAGKSKSDSSDEEDDIVRRDTGDNERQDFSGGNDFDNMMMRKKQENRRRRKRKDIDVINENDDAIAKMIADMRIAAKEDRDLNTKGLPATRKLGMLKTVLLNLRKVDFQMAFIEGNILSVMTDWLAPLPDKSLPHVSIRTEFLKMLEQMKIDDTSRLKESGIGKAVMYLYRHPKEERFNKDLSGRLIYTWARPIFRKNIDFSRMTKEERRDKDIDMAARLGKRKKVSKDDTEEPAPLKPGDPGWIGRARVPMVDNMEYVQRPEWQTDVEINTNKKKKISLLEKHKRAFAERKRIAKNKSLVPISIEGARLKEF